MYINFHVINDNVTNNAIVIIHFNCWNVIKKKISFIMWWVTRGPDNKWQYCYHDDYNENCYRPGALHTESEFRHYTIPVDTTHSGELRPRFVYCLSHKAGFIGLGLSRVNVQSPGPIYHQCNYGLIVLYAPHSIPLWNFMYSAHSHSAILYLQFTDLSCCLAIFWTDRIYLDYSCGTIYRYLRRTITLQCKCDALSYYLQCLCTHPQGGYMVTLLFYHMNAVSVDKGGPKGVRSPLL